MANRFMMGCCKDHLCDMCLSEEERINKHINQELQRLRRQNLYERKLLLLGIDET